MCVLFAGVAMKWEPLGVKSINSAMPFDKDNPTTPARLVFYRGKMNGCRAEQGLSWNGRRYVFSPPTGTSTRFVR